MNLPKNQPASVEPWKAPSLICSGKAKEKQIFALVSHVAAITGVHFATVERAIEVGDIKPDAWTSTGRPMFRLDKVRIEIFSHFNPDSPYQDRREPEIPAPAPIALQHPGRN